MTTAGLCQLCESSVRADDRFCPNCGASVQAGAGGASVDPVGSRWDQLLDRVRGAVAPRYRVERVLGYGGMAGVYLAHETRLARHVAIKVMAPELMLDQTLIHRFRQEAQTIAQLRHPNIVAVHNIDENDGLAYFVMEYVPGRTLARVVASEGSGIPIRAILHWLAQVGSALDYGHRQGIVHRDVKPGNVLLGADGDALVTDFGIAKASDMPGLTRTGMLVGTPAYVSPEYCLTGVVTGASDQYSLGILAFEVLTGRPPFTGPTLATLQAHISEPPPSLTGLRSDCPPQVRLAMERMLLKKPEDRFPDVRAALAAMGAEPLAPDDPLRPELASLSAAVESVTLREIGTPLHVGDSLAVEAEARGAAGKAVSRRPIRWSSDDPNVAIIDGSGSLEAVGPGGATITAECEGVTAEAAVLVLPQPIDEIQLEPIPGPVPSGTSMLMKARLPGNQGNPSGPISWSTSNPNVAVITRDGWVEARNPGVAVIVASVGDQSAAALLTVEASAPAAAPLVAGPAGAEAAIARFPSKWRVYAAVATVLIVVAVGGVFAIAGRDARSETGGTMGERSAGPGSGAVSPLAGSGTAADTRAGTGGAAPRSQAAGSGATDASNTATGEIGIEGRLPAGSVVTATVRETTSPPAAPTPLAANDEAATPPITAAATPETAPTNEVGTDAGAAANAAPAENAPARIRETIDGFASSLETRDVARIEGLYPDASSAWLKQWGPFLTSHDVRDIRASVTDFGPIETDAGASRVPFTILLQWTDLRNAKQQQPLSIMATLREENGAWVIRRLESAP